MKKVLFVADFFANEVRGGAEIYDDILATLFQNDDITTVKLKTTEILDKHIRLYRECGFHVLVSNFCGMNALTIQELVAHPGTYSIMEHDHKYLPNRDPSIFDNFEAPPDKVINRHFYASAKNVFAQSKIHAEVIRKNLKILNVINLGMSLWTDEQLSLIENHMGDEKQPTASIINSTNPTKNTMGTVEFCKNKSIPYTLIGSSDYGTYIEQLAQHETYVYIPKVLETFNRVLLESRMLNCKLQTTSLNGCISEEWFKNYKGKELIEFVREQRPRVYGDIKTAIFENKTETACQSDVTVILNAYRRPYNLKMQIDAIRNQTEPPKHIWLWVNAHEDNEGFDFKSLDIDRIFHNDYNW